MPQISKKRTTGSPCLSNDVSNISKSPELIDSNKHRKETRSVALTSSLSVRLSAVWNKKFRN